MSATILHLIQLHIKPVDPAHWWRGDTDNIHDTPTHMNMANAIDRTNNILWIKNRPAQQLWQTVTPRPANGGLWHGEAADFSRTKAIHHKLLADGKTEEANALDLSLVRC